MLQTLLKDEDARITFHRILAYLTKLSTPVDPSTFHQDSDDPDMVFNEQFRGLINLGRALDVPENDVKIGHWCLRDRERHVKGMDQWSLYWLNLKYDLSEGSNYPIIAETVENGITQRMDLRDIELLLSVWAIGPDDNRIQKAIKIWVESHFGAWEIDSLKAVRR
jgi:hypothetical protein